MCSGITGGNDATCYVYENKGFKGMNSFVVHNLQNGAKYLALNHKTGCIHLFFKPTCPLNICI